MLPGEVAGPEVFIKEEQDVLRCLLIEYEGISIPGSLAAPVLDPAFDYVGGLRQFGPLTAALAAERFVIVVGCAPAMPQHFLRLMALPWAARSRATALSRVAGGAVKGTRR